METDKVEHLTIKPVETGNYRYTIEIDKSVLEHFNPTRVFYLIHKQLDNMTDDLQTKISKVNRGKYIHKRCKRISRDKDNQYQERLDKLEMSKPKPFPFNP